MKINEIITEATATSLRRLGKFHKNNDALAEFVPERSTHRFALHPEKWESTFFSLTNKDPRKIGYYGPEDIEILPGTLVGDMAIANKFYRAKTREEQEQYAKAYKESLKPYPVDVSQYRMPELLIPGRAVAEGIFDGFKKKLTANRGGIDLTATKEDGRVIIEASSQGKRLGLVMFNINGKTLVADRLMVEPEYRGQGIAEIMYDWAKELGYTVKRSGDQTDDGKRFWDKNRGEDVNVWEQAEDAPSEIDEARKRKKAKSKKRRQSSPNRSPVPRFYGAWSFSGSEGEGDGGGE